MAFLKQKLVSGGMDSSMVIWDLERLCAQWRYLVPSATESLNSVMAVDACQQRLVAVTREGSVALIDPLSPSPLTGCVMLTQFVAHSAKTNHVEVSSSETHILTSARDNSAKLWDLRKCSPGLPPLCIYTGHKCVMYPIPARFYLDERFVLTGDDEDGIAIYETCTGKLTRKLPVSGGVSLTEPWDSSNSDFDCVLVQKQRLARVQTAGLAQASALQNTADLEAEKVKNAMQKAIWKFNERIFHHLKAIGKFTMVGYGSLLDVLQTEAENDEECRRIITAVNDQYALYLRESGEVVHNSAEIDNSAADLQTFRRKKEQKSTFGPRVTVERQCKH